MNGSRLSVGAFGDNVRSLHAALRAAGHVVPESEAARSFFGPGTRSAVWNFQAANGLEATGEIDEQAVALLWPPQAQGAAERELEVESPVPRSAPTVAAASNGSADSPRYLVRGVIRYRAGLLAEGLTVRAFNRDVRSEDFLGEAVTNREGRYEIRYSPSQFSRSGKQLADLVLRVFDLRGGGDEAASLLHETATLFDAQPNAKIGVAVEGSVDTTWSEYEQLLEELQALIGDTPIAELDEGDEHRDISFLARQAKVPARRIAFLVVAHKLAARTGLSAEVFYGFARQNLPTTLPELLAQESSMQRFALESSIQFNIIPARLAASLDEILERLRELVVEQAFEARPEADRSSMAELLSTAIDDPVKQRLFLAAYVAHRGPVTEFWKSLEEDEQLKDHVEDLQTNMQLGALAGGHLPVLAELQKRRKAGQFRSLRDLVRLGVADWEDVVRESVVEGGPVAPPEVEGEDAEKRLRGYAARMAQIMEDTYPSDAVASRFQADEDPDTIDMRTFFQSVLAEQNGFELGATRIREYIASNPDSVRDVREIDHLARRLEGAQRIFRLTPRYAELRPILATGIDSALSIARMGPANFLRRVESSIDATAALRVVDRADRAVASAISLFSRFSPSLNGTGMTVLPLQAPDADDLPDWQTLFGSLELCACEHCRSVHGPAAYLVELLAFLKERPTGSRSVRSARDVLFDRRPDLGEIELTCENTNTPLPLVDLVNEILEDAIAPFRPISLAQERAADLDSARVTPELRVAFAAAGAELAKVAAVIVVAAGRRWMVTDHASLYVVVRESAGPRVLSLNRQTAGTAGALAAGPQHVNSRAYEVLRQIPWPWTLPFDLWHEEVRTYLGHLGVAREELIATFSARSDAENVSDSGIANEFLGLSARETRIVNGSAGHAAWEEWGLTENAAIPDPADRSQTLSGAWHQLIARVDVLLERSGLRRTERRDAGYDDLLELLDTRFVNPPDAAGRQRLSVRSIDPEDAASCELHKLAVHAAASNEDEAAELLASAYPKLHRLVRIQRRLGWTYRDVDRALAAFAADGIDDGVLIHLAHVERLHRELRVPVKALLGWWSELDTWRYVRRVGGDNEPELSSYDVLFQNDAVVHPPAQTLRLNESRTELADLGTAEDPITISAHSSEVVAGLGVTETELALLMAELDIPDALELRNLSALARNASLARALQLTVRDYVALRRMSGDDPFERTAGTVRFVETARKIADSGFSIEELDYLLRHISLAGAAVSLNAERVAVLLDEIRIGLQRIADEYATDAEPTRVPGDLAEKRLALLGWDGTLIERVVSTLAGTAAYATDLAILPEDVELPEELAARVRHEDGRLCFIGPMTQNQRATLLALSSDAAYRSAVERLFKVCRRIVTVEMQTFERRVYSVPLTALPAGLRLPRTLRAKVFHDPNDEQLRSLGALTELEFAELSKSTSDAAFQAASDALFQAPDSATAATEGLFLNAADAAQLFDSALSPEARFEHVLERLSPYLQAKLSHDLVIQRLSNHLLLDPGTIEPLVSRWIETSGRAAIEEFLRPEFVYSNVNVRPSALAFPELHETYVRLAKIALIVNRFAIRPEQLEWMLEHSSATGWLDLQSLPLAPQASAGALLAAWEKTYDLFRLRDDLRSGDLALDAVFRAAFTTAAETEGAAANEAKRAWLETVAEWTGWSAVELESLVGARDDAADAGLLGVALPAGVRDEALLVRLQRCFDLIRRTGASAQSCRAWAQPALTAADGRLAQHAVKSRYDEGQWQTVARPLRNELREKQRAALVEYLITHSGGGGEPVWQDAEDLSSHFLIDVEMSACTMTSRIKQGISSIQLFVQRCLLNIESDVDANEDADPQWSDWKWMKNYRVWEANRKIFMYPENWIEPELRDDKSPFFQELEEELLQNELTSDHAETIFQSYLDKLDEVARLEVIGTYHQIEKTRYGATAIDVLHVFGRTPEKPHRYFYRQRVDSARWTAWEPVDLDIEGDHLIPIIWNRRLYLFWPIFIEKAEEGPEGELASQSESNQTINKPLRFWEIQIAWSECRDGVWSAQQITQEALRSESGPDANDRDSSRLRHVFKARTDSHGLEIYCDYEFTTTNPYPPYYGGSPQGFVHVVEGVRGGTFRFESCGGRVKLLGRRPTGILTPRGTRPMGSFYEERGDRALVLPRRLSVAEDGVVLQSTPGRVPFRLLSPHQDMYFSGRRPFFFQDDRKTFFVEPEEVTITRQTLRRPERVNPFLFDLVRREYYAPGAPTDRLRDTSAAALLSGGRPASFPADRLSIGNLSATAPAAALVAGAPDGASPLALGNETAGSAAGMLETPRAPAAAPESEPAAPPLGYRGGALPDSPQRVRAFTTSAFLATRSVPEIVQQQRLFPALVISTQHKERRYRFDSFHDPYVCEFISVLQRDGLDGLMQRHVQARRLEYFEGRYRPGTLVKKPYPVDDVDFSYGGAYSQYHWEIFFHIPLMIAARLSQNQRFEEAQSWFHYIFNPTDTSSAGSPQKYWRTRPFFERSKADYAREQIGNLLARLADEGGDEEFEQQVADWRANPFSPHRIARMRTTAYQKAVVMKYLDNLIAWGDQLFRRDSIESINEATQLYVLAVEILGKRPASIAPRVEPPVQTANSLDPSLAQFSNQMVELERLVLPTVRRDVGYVGSQPPLQLTSVMYFCVSENQEMLEYWDTVADRLFKIRNCMNIEGVVRQLPLFEPPIDPALLVRAIAGGVDISSAISDVNAARPHYRFSTTIQMALGLASEVRTLGQALLTALEKHDAEELALMRSDHEVRVLEAVELVREKQIEEAREAQAALERTRAIVEHRRDYYRDVEKINSNEQLSLDKQELAKDRQSLGQGLEILAGALALIPDVDIGIAGAFGSPKVSAAFGGQQMSTAVQVASRALSLLSSIANFQAGRASTLGGYDRRWDDWKLQEELAELELEQIERQIEGAQVRVQVAEQELRNQKLQIENAKTTGTFLQRKFTNRELYGWMIGQISGLYFQAYQMAYDMAKRAERSLQHELAVDDTSFIQFGYWNNLRKGLMAGERLFHDLKRLEITYQDRNKREYELTQHVSLSTLDPLALFRLRETGEAFVDVPESVFDLDHPGHYMRHIRSVSVTIPCVVGPYSGVPCTLTLIRSSIRRSSALRAGQYRRDAGDEDGRFRDTTGTMQSIVTSHAQNDAGLFELNFRDERYLPFEGFGVISSWRIRLPADFRPFDYDTISDVVLHFRYTAREGGDALGQQVLAEMEETLAARALADNRRGLFRMFSLRRDFPGEWHRFLTTPDADMQDRVQEFGLARDHFPYYLAGHELRITAVQLIAFARTEALDPFDVYLRPSADAPNDDTDRVALESDPALPGILRQRRAYAPGSEKSPDAWTLTLRDGDLDSPAERLLDLGLVFEYRAALPA